MNSRQKGRIGHQYTEQYLRERGWSTYTCPHATLQWEGGSSGWKDAFAAPDENGKLQGGFDIIALKKVCCENKDTKFLEATLWQVKKTKRNPITHALKRDIIRSAEHHNLLYSACYIIWWPDGIGPKSKTGPVIWNPEKGLS